MEGGGAGGGPGRMEAYSDAVFSIIATVMILPIAHSHIDTKANLNDVLLNQFANKIVIYICCFFIVASLWKQHNRLFQYTHKVDEAIIIMNLGYLMAVTFLPFVFTLFSEFPLEKLAAGLLLATRGFLGILEFIIICYIFGNPANLKAEIANSEYKISLRNWMLSSTIMTFVITVFATIFLFVNVFVSLCLMLPYVYSESLRRLLYYVFYRFRENVDTYTALKTTFKRKMNKERMECFSDGVFAIVATLIILDICEDAIPSVADVTKTYSGSLSSALAEHVTLFMAYGGTFVTVTMLWFVHHTLFQNIKETNAVMDSFNNVFLALVGLSPLGFTLTSKFTDTTSYNEMIAIQFSSAITFLAAICQAFIWVVALRYPGTYTTPESSHGKPAHLGICLKLAVYPVASLFTYFLAINSETITIEVFYSVQLGTPVLFLILNSVPLYKFCKRPSGTSLSLTIPDVPYNNMVEQGMEESSPSLTAAPGLQQSRSQPI